MLNIKERILKSWRLLNIAIILSFIAGLTSFIIKTAGYPRILTDFILSLKEFADSFFYAFVYVFPLIFLIYVAFIINKKGFYFIISAAFSLAMFGGIGYFLNRVVFSDLFMNKTLIGGVKVRLVYVTAKSLIPNILLLIGFFLFTYFLYRWIAALGEYLAGKKFRKQYDRNMLFSGKIALIYGIFFLGLIVIFLAVMYLLPEKIETELILLAMGFVHPVHEGLLTELGISLNSRKNIAMDPAMATNVEKVFAAGDAASGASLVVNAIASGRRAAKKIYEFLTSSGE